MARVLGVLLLIGLAWLVFKRTLGRANRRDQSIRDAQPPRFEKTVRCARCGAYTPLALVRFDAQHNPICKTHDSRGDDHERDPTRD